MGKNIISHSIGVSPNGMALVLGTRTKAGSTPVAPIRMPGEQMC